MYKDGFLCIVSQNMYFLKKLYKLAILILVKGIV